MLCKRNCRTRSSSLTDIENPSKCMYYPKTVERSGHEVDTETWCNHELNEIDPNSSPYETIDFSSDDSSDLMSSNLLACQKKCIFLSQSKVDVLENVDTAEYLCPAPLTRETETIQDTKDDKYITVI